MLNKTKLKDKMGRHRTSSLFLELNDDGLTPLYTLDEEHKDDLQSAYLIYMESATEYEAAQRLVGSWEHWKKLLRSKAVSEYIERWREEKEVRLMAMGITAMITAATVPDMNGKTSTAAARWLAETGGNKKNKRKTLDKEVQTPQELLLEKILADSSRLNKKV